MIRLALAAVALASLLAGAAAASRGPADACRTYVTTVGTIGTRCGPLFSFPDPATGETVTGDCRELDC